MRQPQPRAFTIIILLLSSRQQPSPYGQPGEHLRATRSRVNDIHPSRSVFNAKTIHIILLYDRISLHFSRRLQVLWQSSGLRMAQHGPFFSSRRWTQFFWWRKCNYSAYSSACCSRRLNYTSNYRIIRCAMQLLPPVRSVRDNNARTRRWLTRTYTAGFITIGRDTFLLSSMWTTRESNVTAYAWESHLLPRW